MTLQNIVYIKKAQKYNYKIMKNTMKVAICYDFDGTLAPGNMQEYGFMEALNMKADDFWKKSDTLSDETSADKNLCYMLTMLKEANARNVSFRKDNMANFAKNIPFFKGVETWFERINAYARQQGIELQHFLLSSGLKEIILGCPIAKEFTKIYACSFLYDANGVAIWPAQVVNYTTKTQYLFRINKGCLDERDISVNEKTPHELREIPFQQMMYVGDGLTDVPCMTTLRKFGGSAIAVYKPKTKNAKRRAEKLLKDNRVDNIAIADYSEGGKMEKIVKAWLTKIKADSNLKS